MWLPWGAGCFWFRGFDVNELRARLRSGKRILELQHALLRVQTALQFESAHDHLTGLWNRGAIMDLLQRETQRCERTGEPLGIMIADLDHFKQINDSYGHQTGDAVLHEVARRLLASVRNDDYVGRYGGEEFLIFLGTAQRLLWRSPWNGCGYAYRASRLTLILDRLR